MVAYHGYLPEQYAMVTYHGYLPEQYAMVTYHGYLPEQYAMVTYHGYLPEQYAMVTSKYQDTYIAKCYIYIHILWHMFVMPSYTIQPQIFTIYTLDRVLTEIHTPFSFLYLLCDTMI